MSERPYHRLVKILEQMGWEKSGERTYVKGDRWVRVGNRTLSYSRVDSQPVTYEISKTLADSSLLRVLFGYVAKRELGKGDDPQHIIEIEDHNGGLLKVQMKWIEPNLYLGTVYINGVPYHVNEMTPEFMADNYKVDDPEQVPVPSRNGRVWLITPYMQ